MTETWTWIMQVAVIIATLTAGGGAVWIVQQLKAALNLRGSWALLLTAVVSLAMALAALVIDGTLSAEGLRPENLGVAFTLVFMASQAIYRRLDGGK